VISNLLKNVEFNW